MKRPKILLVDDDPKLTTTVAAFLSQDGSYEVREENESSRAVKVARKCRPDVAILDIDMPGKHGGQVASDFRNDPRLRGITLIFMSALVSDSEKGIRNGAIYLPKPFPLEVLDQVVKLVITRRSGLSSSTSSDSGEMDISSN